MKNRVALATVVALGISAQSYAVETGVVYNRQQVESAPMATIQKTVGRWI